MKAECGQARILFIPEQCKLSLEWLTTNQSLFFSMSVACC